MSDMDERVDLTNWKLKRLMDSGARKRRSKKRKQEDKENKHRKKKYGNEED